MATLTGKITDVTSKAPENITSITVKAPSVRIGSGTDVIVSSPAEVTFDRTTGDITISGLTGGLSWLYIEGDGWSDSIPLAVAEGMITLVEAIANAAGAPGMTDYVRLLARLELAVDDIVQDAVDWAKPAISNADTTRIPGAYRATTSTVGLPDEAKNMAGTFEVLPAGTNFVTQRFTATGLTQETWERTQRDSTEWYPWNRVLPIVKELIGHVDDVTEGTFYTGFSTEGLPADATTIHGSFEVLKSRTQLTQRFTTWGLNPEVWLRSRQTETNFYPWSLQPRSEDVDDLSHRIDEVESTPATSTQGFKEVPLSLTAGVGDSEGAPNDGTYRVIGEWGVPIKRWRICVSTRNPRYNMAGSAGVSIRRITAAKHAGGGATTGDNYNVLTSSVSLDDREPWRSEWVNASIDKNTEFAFGIEYRGTPPLLEGYGFRLPDGTNPQLKTATGTATNRVPFDIWLEVEAASTTPVVAAIGDSTSVGAGATREVVDSWLGLYCRENGALPVHYAASGDSAYNWGRKTDGYQMTRWAHLSQPDAVIFALGNNDMNTTTDGLTMSERVTQLIPYVRRHIGANLYAATVKPRRTLTSENIATRNAYTAWLTTTGRQYFRDVFDFHTPVAIGDLLDPQYDSGDGTHLNDAGYARLASAVNTPIISPTGRIYDGVGSPEGEVMAPVGAIYSDTVATMGAIRWVKTNGTGTTGWRVDYGDTGWRDITSELTASVKSGKVLIRRVGDSVHVALDALLLDETGTTTIYRFDAPFRPDYTKAGSWYIDSSSVVTDGSFQIFNLGYFPVYLVDPNTPMTANFSFLTGRDWPTSLPGTPV